MGVERCAGFLWPLVVEVASYGGWVLSNGRDDILHGEVGQMVN